jgi:hypothetical protein
MGFPSAIPCSDPNCPHCHGKEKYYRLDFYKTPGIRFRPQNPPQIAPLEIKELARPRPAFDEVLDSILDECLRSLPYPYWIRGSHDSWSSEEIRIGLELRHFLDERR